MGKLAKTGHFLFWNYGKYCRYYINICWKISRKITVRNVVMFHPCFFLNHNLYLLLLNFYFFSSCFFSFYFFFYFLKMHFEQLPEDRKKFTHKSHNTSDSVNSFAFIIPECVTWNHKKTNKSKQSNYHRFCLHMPNLGGWSLPFSHTARFNFCGCCNEV